MLSLSPTPEGCAQHWLEGFLQSVGCFYTLSTRYSILCEKLHLSEGNKFTEGTLEKIGKKVKRWAAEASRLPGPLQWVTGTRSPALIGISRTVPHTGIPALVPTGILIGWHIAPLTGELDMGISRNGINQNHLSGNSLADCKTAYDYSQREEYLYDVKEAKALVLQTTPDHFSYKLSAITLAILRVVQMDSDKESKQQIARHLRDSILPKMQPNPTEWELCARLIGKEVPLLPLALAKEHKIRQGKLVGIEGREGKRYFGQVIDFFQEQSTHEGYYTVITSDEAALSLSQRDIPEYRVVSYEAHAVEELAKKQPPLPPETLKKMGLAIKSPLQYLEEVNALLRYIDEGAPLSLSEEEKLFLSAPFPLIWGTSKTLPFSDYFDESIPERSVRGACRLEKEIDVVFTKKREVERVQAWLLAQKVEVLVLSLGTLAYLQPLAIAPDQRSAL